MSERRFDIAKSLNMFALTVMCVVVALGISGCGDGTAVIPLPTIIDISPTSGRQGTTVHVSIHGTNLVIGATDIRSVGGGSGVGAGITLSNMTINSATGFIEVDFTIASSASIPPAGMNRSLFIHTIGGDSNTVLFTVTP